MLREFCQYTGRFLSLSRFHELRTICQSFLFLEKIRKDKWSVQKAIRLVICLVICNSFSIFAQQEFKSAEYQLPSNFAKDIVIGTKSTFIATASGVVQLNGNAKSGKVYNKNSGLPDDFITSLSLSPEETNLWVGTPSGLAKIELDSGKIETFSRRNRQLSDDRVSSVLVDQTSVYVGTQFGVDRYDKVQNRWVAYTAIEGLAGNNIQVLAAEGDIIWAGGADGLSYYDKNEDFWISYDATNGLTAGLITALSVDADAIWVGTAGGGLGRFDKASLRFEMFTTSFGLADDNVQTLVDDGGYLWVGTFDGISRLEKQTLRFTNFHTKDGLREPSVTTGALSGQTLYVGTDGGGIYAFNKQIPQVSFSYQLTSYNEPKEIYIFGTILSEDGIRDVKLRYRPAESLKNEWFDKGISVSGTPSGKNIRLGKVSTGEIQDGRYTIAIDVEDKDGRVNRSYGAMVIDNIAPQIELLFRAPRPDEREVTVTGKYNEANLTSLGVQIGNRRVFPTIDRAQRRFRFPYPLNSAGKIKVIAEDVGKNSTTIEKAYVVDNEPPELEISPYSESDINGNKITIRGFVKDKNIDQVLINPGQIPTTLTPAGEERYEFSGESAIKKEGRYVFQITAFDKSGRTTTKPLEVKFYSETTIIEIDDDKITQYTLKDNVELSGNILGPSLKEFYIEPGNIKIPVRQDKSFSIKIPLKSGPNEFTMVAIHKTGERAVQTFNIESSNRTVAAPLNLDSRSFGEPNVTLTGTYDRGITKVLVNKKPAQMDQRNSTYSAEVRLKEGENPIAITTVDEIGRTKTINEKVYYDKEAPRFYLRSLPAQTGMAVIRIKGRVEEISQFKLSAFPGIIIEGMNVENGDFYGKLYLKPGVNRIFFNVVDAAGNKTAKEYVVQHDLSYPKLEWAEGAENFEEIMALRREVSLLKRQLAGLSHLRRPTGIVAQNLPAIAGLYMVPSPGKIPDYEISAQLYLGSGNLAGLLASYNGRYTSGGNKILVPSPELFALLNKTSKRDTYHSIIKSAGVAYRKTPTRSGVENGILTHLTRARLLKNVVEQNNFTLFTLKNGTAILVTSDAKVRPAKNAGTSEILIAKINSNGVVFSRY
ncbi:MAG: hypothetical protein KDK41_09360 [Leptospiraceae bacterium]|nr:hypothetical protein [Leptospiraceae bacterium]